MSTTATHPISFPDEPGLYESAMFPIRDSDAPPYYGNKPYLVDEGYRFWLAGSHGGPDMSIRPGATVQLGPYRKLDVEVKP